MNYVYYASGSVYPTTSTLGTPKAIYMFIQKPNTPYNRVITNVNPTTGDVDNTDLYECMYSSGTVVTWSSTSGLSFVITDSSIATNVSPDNTGNRYVAFLYSY